MHCSFNAFYVIRINLMQVNLNFGVGRVVQNLDYDPVRWPGKCTRCSNGQLVYLYTTKA